MDIEKALSVVSRQAPCAHDNASTDLGNGKIWAACEDCGETFPQNRWDNARQASKGFDDAIYAIRDEIARLRDELTTARKTNSEWLAANGPGGWINDLRDENERLRTIIPGEVERMNDELCDENESLRGSLEEWKLDLNSLRDENASMSAQLIAFQTAWPGGVDEVSSVITSLRDESAVLRTQLAESQSREAQLRERLNSRLKAERERCAGVCDDDEHKYETGRCCAIAIRDLSDEPIHPLTDDAAMQKGE